MYTYVHMYTYLVILVTKGTRDNLVFEKLVEVFIFFDYTFCFLPYRGQGTLKTIVQIKTKLFQHLSLTDILQLIKVYLSIPGNNEPVAQDAAAQHVDHSEGGPAPPL